MTDEQLQYACDLLNSNNDRMDAGQMKCKVGKPCNGRCIPQDHQCQPDGTGRRLMEGGEEYETYHHIHGYQQELTPKGQKVIADYRKKEGRKVLLGTAVLGASALALASGVLKPSSKVSQKQAEQAEEILKKNRERDRQHERQHKKNIEDLRRKASAPKAASHEKPLEIDPDGTYRRRTK